MTAFDYSRLAATAARMLARFGQSGTLHRVSTSGGADPTVTEADETITAAVMAYDASEIDGQTILRNDVRVYVAALASEPSTKDFVTVGGIRMAIKSVATLTPAGTAVYHVLQGRQ